MRRIVLMTLVVIFATMAAGLVQAQKADKCAAEKKAVDAALANYKTAEKTYMAAIDAMADAYGEVSEAQASAKTKHDAYIAAAKKSSAAWDVYYNCQGTAANNDCKAERDATRKATAEFEAAEKASRDADLALGAAQMVLDEAKARFRAAAAAEKAAKEALDAARLALAKCQRRFA
jgi:hypothetical protein